MRQSELVKVHLARKWARAKELYALAISSKNRVVATTQERWTGLLGKIAERTEKLGERERWVRRRDTLRTNLEREWVRSSEPIHAGPVVDESCRRGDEGALDWPSRENCGTDREAERGRAMDATTGSFEPART